MVDGLFSFATLTGRRGGHTPFVQAGAEMSDTGVEQGCGVRSPVIRLRLLAISIIRLRLQPRLRLRTDSDLQLY